MAKRRQIYVTFDEEVLDTLDDLCATSKRSRSSVLAILVEAAKPEELAGPLVLGTRERGRRDG